MAEANESVKAIESRSGDGAKETVNPSIVESESVSDYGSAHAKQVEKPCCPAAREWLSKVGEAEVLWFGSSSDQA